MNSASLVHRMFRNSSGLRADWKLEILVVLVVALIKAGALVIRYLLPAADHATSGTSVLGPLHAWPPNSTQTLRIVACARPSIEVADAQAVATRSAQRLSDRMSAGLAWARRRARR